MPMLSLRSYYYYYNMYEVADRLKTVRSGVVLLCHVPCKWVPGNIAQCNKHNNITVITTLC